MRCVPLLAIVCLVCLPGCDDLTAIFGSPQERAKHAMKGGDPFDIGSASKYAEPGLYFDFAQEHNVVLRSDHGMLVALLLISPDNGSVVQYDRLSNMFRDPRSGYRFTSDGVKSGGPDDRPSLARCRIRHLGPLDDPHVELVVDPGKLFRQEDQAWSKAASNHLFVGSGGR